MSVDIEKAALRKHFLEKRDAVSADLREISSAKIYNYLKQSEPYKHSQNIACYFSIGSEVDTHSIMLDILSNGKNLLLPTVVDSDLEFRIVTDLKKLEKGHFDIMEPRDNCEKSEEIDCVIVPTVAVSKSGTRLGYGRGYYDKFLSRTNAMKISLTYSTQIVGSIPSDSHDVNMDWIVTEEGIIKSS